jgi:tetratricopeptide (TPR) repeat protein
LAGSSGNLGNVLRDLGKRAEAEVAYRRALALQEQLVADFPALPEHRQGLARSYNNLGPVLVNLGRSAEAEAAFRQALAIREKLAADFPGVPDYRMELAGAHNNLGALLVRRGKRAEAEAAFRQALAVQDKLLADFPKVPAYHQQLAYSCTNYGTLLCSHERAQDSLELFAKAISLLQANLATDAHSVKDRLYLRYAHLRRAQALTTLHRYPEALNDWDQAIALDPGPLRPAFRLQRAVTLARAGDHTKAVAEADEITQAAKTPGDMLYNAACVYGLSTAAAKDDGKRKEQYAGNAVALLRRAQVAGYFKSAAEVEHLQKDDDLAALRGRADFQQFVSDLQKKHTPKP